MNQLVNEYHAERGCAACFVMGGGEFDLLAMAVDAASDAAKAIVPRSFARRKPSTKEVIIRAIKDLIEDIIDVLPLHSDNRNSKSIGHDARRDRISTRVIPLLTGPRREAVQHLADQSFRDSFFHASILSSLISMSELVSFDEVESISAWIFRHRNPLN